METIGNYKRKMRFYNLTPDKYGMTTCDCGKIISVDNRYCADCSEGGLTFTQQPDRDPIPMKGEPKDQRGRKRVEYPMPVLQLIRTNSTVTTQDLQQLIQDETGIYYTLEQIRTQRRRMGANRKGRVA